MKKYIIFGLMLCLLVSCKQESILMFNEKIAKLYFDIDGIGHDFLEISEISRNVQRSEVEVNLANMRSSAKTVTIKLRVNLLGNLFDKDKKITFEQVHEENLPEGQKEAESGKHYVSFAEKDFIFTTEEAKTFGYFSLDIVLKPHKDLIQAKYNYDTYEYEEFHSDKYKLKIRIVNNDNIIMSKEKAEISIIFYYKEKNPNAW
jgi:hypothetical protein